VDLHGGDDSASTREQQISKDLVLKMPSRQHVRKDLLNCLGARGSRVHSSIKGLITLSGRGAWRYFPCWWNLCAASHQSRYLLTSSRQRKQVDPKLADLHFMEATRSIIEEDGIKLFWVGLEFV
jgi:hypothetical protein